MDSEKSCLAELPEPWYWTEQDLGYQLAIEVGKAHILYKKPVITLARRLDKDDVLFQVENSFAIVHLTWSRKAHSEATWPITKIYTSWSSVREQIDEDAEDYNS
jgi:hypothetical protein